MSFGTGAVAAAAKTAHTISKFAKIIRSAVSTWKISKRISEGVKKAHDIGGVRKRLERIKNLGRKAKSEESIVGPGVRTTSGTPLSITRAQIEKKFEKHAADFGVTEPRGKAGFEAFERAVREQVGDPATLHINGTYRGNSAVLNYNPNTGLAVIQSPSGQFISAWRLGDDQVSSVLERGMLR